MKLFYVHKEKYFRYSENRGVIVAAKDWQRAKGIAMVMWKDQNRDNVKVEEVEIKEGIVCYTDYLMNTDEYN